MLFGRAAKNVEGNGSRKIVVSNKDLEGERRQSDEPHNKKDEPNQVNYEDDFEESDNGADYNNDFEEEQDGHRE